MQIPSRLKQLSVDALSLPKERRDLGICEHRAKLGRTRQVQSLTESACENPKVERPIHLLNPAQNHATNAVGECLEIIDLDHEALAVRRTSEVDELVS